MRKMDYDWGCLSETYHDGVLVKRVVRLHYRDTTRDTTTITLYDTQASIGRCNTLDDKSYYFVPGTMPYLWTRTVMRFRPEGTISVCYDYDTSGAVKHIDRYTHTPNSKASHHVRLM